MKKTRRTVEQIIRILREADRGMSVEEICRRHNISTQSYYRWRSKYGGMDLKEAQRLRDLEKEPSSSEIDNHKVVARRVVPAGTIKIVSSRSCWPTRCSKLGPWRSR